MARGRSELREGSDVLVVGAGPTGLATALQASANGAHVRLVERRPEPFRPSRAMIMHSRTLEVLRPLGVVEDLLDRADGAPRAQLHFGARTVAVQLGDVGLRDTAYPHLTLVRQADVEDVLAGALAARGVTVERDVELVGVSWAPDERVRALLRADGEVSEVASRYLAGCDGADSLVRRLTGVGWRGGRYGQEVVLADIELEGGLAPGMLHVAAGRRGLVFLFALGEGATWRLLGTRPVARDAQGAGGQPSDLPVPEVQRLLDDAGLGVRVTEQVWSARVPLQHRMASSFRQGPVFLAGDAAHAGSPAGGQGMNTGIVDAVNLGWKLAVARVEPGESGEPNEPDPASGPDGRHAALLGSYDLERRPAAAQVLALTHLIFFAEASTHPLPAFVRGTALPFVAPALPVVLRQPPLMAAVVALLSQRWVRYRTSPLSVAGVSTSRGARPGDRLPDQTLTCNGRSTRLHDLTARPGLHVLLERGTAAPDLHGAGLPVTVHRIDDWPGNGLVVVRPDGHVGYRTGRLDGGDLSKWLRLITG